MVKIHPRLESPNPVPEVRYVGLVGPSTRAGHVRLYDCEVRNYVDIPEQAIAGCDDASDELIDGAVAIRVPRGTRVHQTTRLEAVASASWVEGTIARSNLSAGSIQPVAFSTLPCGVIITLLFCFDNELNKSADISCACVHTDRVLCPTASCPTVVDCPTVTCRPSSVEAGCPQNQRTMTLPPACRPTAPAMCNK